MKIKEVKEMSFKRLLTDIFVLIVIVSFVASIGILSLATKVYRSYNIITKEEIMNRRDTGLTLMDRNGKEFFAFQRSRPGALVPLKEIPVHVRQAIIVAEDETFPKHYGFSIKGIARSVYLNWQNKELSYGGSTLTQQLAKNSFLTPDKSFNRKFNELVLAIKFERTFPKSDILEMYLNSAYFGEGVFGIESASQTYFNKNVANLSLAEVTLLAGILPQPSNFSPLSGNNKEENKKRQFINLQKMVDAGYISEDQKITAQSEELIYNHNQKEINSYAPHFALMVRDDLYEKFGEENVVRSGFRVKTTIDLENQKEIEGDLKNHVAGLNGYNANNGAVVILDTTTSEVLSLVGSANWHDAPSGMINMATHPRQTGSAFKPIVFATALQEKIITPSTVLKDSPRTFGTNYKPRNYDGRFRGNILARKALANSINIPTVDLMVQAGPHNVVKMAGNMGISTMSEQSEYYLSTALGSEKISLLEMTYAYGIFANQGKKVPLKTIIEIKDKYEATIDYQYEEPRQILPAGVAFQISSILSDKNARSATFGNMLDLPFTTAVKTGTTQDYKDAWTIGYTPRTVAGVWIGNSNNTSMINLPGARGSAPLWKNLMQKYAENSENIEFTQPPDVLAIRVCHHNGLPIRGERGSGYTEYFLIGTEPSGTCVIPTPTPTPDGEKEEDSPQDKPPQIAGTGDNEKTVLKQD